MKKVICVTGDRSGVGKSTAAKIFAEVLDGEIISLAEPIKVIAYQMGWDGEKDAKGRKLLQTLGTECGRNLISKDIWLNKWFKEVREAESDVVICDDVRFQNEYDFVSANTECVFFHIVTGKPSLLEKWWRNLSAHESEKGYVADSSVVKIENFGSLKEFEATVYNMARNQARYWK